uniref:ATP-dependent RNA helicase n=1 Tax=Hirondellea gigas TaxID=1518452 RepID=A0A2P2I0P8_9CRUS
MASSTSTENHKHSLEEHNEEEETSKKPKLDEFEKLATDSSLNYDVLASRSFDALRGFVSAPTMEAIESYGFESMTEIQARAIPPLLEGKDLRGTAKTGSGKTLAFLIPAIELLHKLEFEPCHGTGVIVLCPTRELSMQSYGVARMLADRHKFTHGLIIGGANRKAETENLKKGVNILIATPGRMLDHLKNTKGFQYSNLVCLILDEADRMLSIGFEEEMKAILKVIPKRRQTMLFSATRTKKTDELTTLALKVTLVDVDVDADKDAATVDQLTQSYLVCSTEQRFLILYTFLKRKKNKKMMVFFSSCDSVRFYHDLLNYIDLPVLCIHGKQKQAKRTEAFFSFNAAKSATLLCTDVAARGWDIPEVDWIVQYDPPEDPSEYIHRVGRTARGGRDGQALLILRQEELPFVRYLRERKVTLNPIEVQQDKIYKIQRQLEKLMNKNYFLASSGRLAFKSYIHAYMKHRNKEIFNVHHMDMSKVAKSFGFDNPPVIDLTINHDKKRSKEYKKQRMKRNS